MGGKIQVEITDEKGRTWKAEPVIIEEEQKSEGWGCGAWLGFILLGIGIGLLPHVFLPLTLILFGLALICRRR